MTKVIDTLHNFVNAPKNHRSLCVEDNVQTHISAFSVLRRISFCKVKYDLSETHFLILRLFKNNFQLYPVSSEMGVT